MLLQKHLLNYAHMCVADRTVKSSSEKYENNNEQVKVFSQSASHWLALWQMTRVVMNHPQERVNRVQYTWPLAGDRPYQPEKPGVVARHRNLLTSYQPFTQKVKRLNPIGGSHVFFCWLVGVTEWQAHHVTSPLQSTCGWEKVSKTIMLHNNPSAPAATWSP